MSDAPPSFARIIALIEEHGLPPETRPEAPTAALVERHPRLADVTVEAVGIDGPHGPVPARLYAAGERTGDALVWLHGGAFVGGSLDMPEAHWVGLALAAEGIPVLSADYRKALDGVHFPVPLDDAVAAWDWAAAHLADRLGPVERLHVGGASAGGTLAAATTLRRCAGGGRRPDGLVLVYAVLHAELPPLDPALRAAVAAAPAGTMVFTPAMGREIARNYVGDERRLGDPLAFPAAGDLSVLPPTYVLNAECDSLRASGEAFAAQATGAGADILVECEPGAVHGFLDTPREPHGARAVERIARWLTRR
jgi:acetyl esterase